MANKIKASKLPTGKRIKYRLQHRLVPKTLHFDSWMTLCEYVMEVAEEEAKKQLHDTLLHHICTLSDEIIKTAEEINLNENNWNLRRYQIDRGIHTNNHGSSVSPLFGGEDTGFCGSISDSVHGD